MLSRSIRHHYGAHFEGQLYLEKIFDLRLHLPQLNAVELKSFVREKLNELRAWLEEYNTEIDFDSDDLESIFAKLGRRATPRMIERILLKCRYLLRGEKVPAGEVNFALLWLTLAQAFPETRRAFLNTSSKDLTFLSLFKDPKQRVNVMLKSLGEAEKQYDGQPWFSGCSREVIVDGNLVHEDGVNLLRHGYEMFSDNKNRFYTATDKIETLFRRRGLL